jgi:hypothetical protein
MTRANIADDLTALPLNCRYPPVPDAFRLLGKQSRLIRVVALVILRTNFLAQPSHAVVPRCDGRPVRPIGNRLGLQRFIGACTTILRRPLLTEPPRLFGAAGLPEMPPVSEKLSPG